MLVVDAVIATLVLFAPIAQIVALRVPGTSLWLSDLRIPLLVAIVVALAVPALRRGGWKAWPAEGRARVPRDLAVAGLALGAAAVAWRLLGFDLGVAVWQLTFGAGAVPLAALCAAAALRWSGARWEDSFFFRCSAALWRAWRGALERRPARALWGAAAAAGVFYLWIALWRHWAFDTHGYDLGIFTNAMWNLIHGHGYVSSVKGGINLFTDHQSPLFWLLAPVFWLAPRPETLLVAQAFGLAAGGPALFYLARAHFAERTDVAAALPWLYWSYLPLRYANAFDFHPEVFMLPLFLWAFAAFAAPRRSVKLLGLLALLGALGAKESAPVVAAGLGVAWALVSPQRSWRAAWPGIALAVAGVALFFFDLKVVPRLFGADYAYMGHYKQFGGGIADVLLAPVTQPALFFSTLVNQERLLFLFWTLAPLGFVPLFAWRAALAAVPVYLMLFLTAGDQRVQIYFHYGIEPASALFWALPFGLAAFAARFGWRWAGAWMLFWALACLRPFEAGWPNVYGISAHQRWLAAEALPCVDPALPVAATDVLIPRLSTRPWVSYPYALVQRSGEPVSCVLSELRLDNWPLGPGGMQRVLDGLPAQGYREVFRCRSFSVYERTGAGCLRCLPQCR